MNFVFLKAQLSVAALVLVIMVQFTLAQTLPTGVVPVPFYDFKQVSFDKDKVKTIGMWEVPGKPQHFFVLDQNGLIYSLYPDTTKTYGSGQLKDYSKKLLISIQDKVHQRIEAEYGAYSIAFHPQFQKNHFFYLLYLGYRPGQLAAADTGHRSGGMINIERWSVGASYAQIQMDTTVFTYEHLRAYGTSSMNFGPDGYLYIALSDYKADGWDTTTVARKVLRIDVDKKDPGKGYAIPTSNPYFKSPNPDVKKEIWASGFRNAWSFAFDFQTGKLWLGDVGNDFPDSYEEINIVQPKKNYGWADKGNSESPVVGYGIQGKCPTDYSIKGLTCANLQDPDFVWKSGAADATQMRCIIVGPAFRGDPTSPFYGFHFVADVWSNRIWAVKEGSQPQLVGQSPSTITPNMDGHDGIVHFSEDAYGNIYVTMLSWYRGERFHEIYRLSHPALRPRATPTSLNNGHRSRGAPGRLILNEMERTRIEIPEGYSRVDLYNFKGEKIWSQSGNAREPVLVPPGIWPGVLHFRFQQ